MLCSDLAAEVDVLGAGRASEEQRGNQGEECGSHADTVPTAGALRAMRWGEAEGPPDALGRRTEAQGPR